MTNTKRPVALWIIVVFLALSFVLLLAGQATAVFDYELAVRMGLQERVAEVGEFGVRTNRAFGAADTAVYLPLILASLAGLLLRMRWSLITTAAVAGISLYWSVTVVFMLLFLPGAPSYDYVPGSSVWTFVCAYGAFGAWCLLYLLKRGEALLNGG